MKKYFLQDLDAEEEVFLFLRRNLPHIGDGNDIC